MTAMRFTIWRYKGSGEGNMEHEWEAACSYPILSGVTVVLGGLFRVASILQSMSEFTLAGEKVQAVQSSKKSDVSPKLQSSLQILENLIYLIKNEVPGSAAQMVYLARAEEEISSLRTPKPTVQ